MAIRILVNGAHGKMGTIAVKTLIDHPDFTLVDATGKNDNLALAIQKSRAQVVVDLTHATVAFNNSEIIIDAGAHPVIGTSGLIKTEVEKLKKKCFQLKLGGIIVPNFSLGAVLMMKQAQSISKYFTHVEIIEMHHNNKLDSPSATALRTAEMIATTRAIPSSQPDENRHETVTGARGATYQDIAIHAVRMPGLLAYQQVIFGELGETLTLTHNVIDRQCYMAGMVLACQKVMELAELVYGLENIL